MSNMNPGQFRISREIRKGPGFWRPTFGSVPTQMSDTEFPALFGFLEEKSEIGRDSFSTCSKWQKTIPWRTNRRLSRFPRREKEPPKSRPQEPLRAFFRVFGIPNGPFWLRFWAFGGICGARDWVEGPTERARRMFRGRFYFLFPGSDHDQSCVACFLIDWLYSS